MTKKKLISYVDHVDQYLDQTFHTKKNIQMGQRLTWMKRKSQNDSHALMMKGIVSTENDCFIGDQEYVGPL
jgi:hypothetical protein